MKARTDRVRDLDQFFVSGAVVCPYAKVAEKVYVTDRNFLNPQNRAITSAIANSCAVIVSRENDSFDDLSFTDARQWVHAVCGSLRCKLGAEADVRGDRWSSLFRCAAGNFYAIGMGPQYPVSHPRYAPRLCVVVVNESDIQKVPATIRGAIIDSIIERYGGTYDADEVWLPINLEKRQ